MSVCLDACPCCPAPDFECSFPVLLEVSVSDPYTGTACLQQPTTTGPWAKYVCSACYNGACIDSDCSIGVNRRRLLEPACATGDACVMSLESNATNR